MPLVATFLVYVATGCAAGYLAGLFGVGGGIIVVPVLTVLFQQMGIAQEINFQLSIGTSMAVVALTALSSTRTHNRNGNVDWDRVRSILPAVLIGVATGAVLGASVSRKVLMASVISFELVVALQFLYQGIIHSRGAGADAETLRSRFQMTPVLVVSALLGAISSVVGIAGGTLFVPFLNYCGVGLRRSIGTAAALGVPVGVVAAAIYLALGTRQATHLPPYSLGYIYLPALAGCAVGSLWTTVHGANLAKRMKVRELKIAFAAILLLAAAKMVRTVLA